MSGGTAGSQSGAAGSGGAGSKAGTGGSAGAGGGTATGGSGGQSSCALPSTFKWTTGAPVILPKSDATHDLVAVKDPTVVRYNDRWHLFASSVTKAGAYNMVYMNFANWSEASAAPFYYMDQTPNFNTFDPCHFEFVYQGFDPAADGSPYNSLPWKLGLLTRTP